MSIYFKLFALFIFWLVSILGSYWFGWSSDANIMSSKHDLSAKILHLSMEERKRREEARKERARLMIMGFTLFVIFLVLVVIIDSAVRP